MYLGEFIKRYREEHKLSMEEFASRANLSKGYISMLEKNRNPKNNESIIPSIETFQKVAKAMNTTISYIMEHVDENQPVALEYVMDYSERENVKGKSKNELHLQSLSLDEKVIKQTDVFRCLFARSFEANKYNLYHANFSSYISMLLFQDHFKKSMDSETYAALTNIYSLIDGTEYDLVCGRTYFVIPNIQGNYDTILDSQVNINGDIIRTINKLNPAGKDRVLSYAKDLSSSPRYAMPAEHSVPVAAHERTDIEVTDEMRKHDDDIMNDDNF